MGANGTADICNDTLPFQEGDPDYNFAALVLGVFLILFIISGNLLVCLSVYTEKALKTTTNYFIVSLAVADLLLAILVLPLYVYTEVKLQLLSIISFVLLLGFPAFLPQERALPTHIVGTQ